MKKIFVSIAVCLSVMSAILFARTQAKSPLRVVPAVDLTRYAGQWYEIARFPNRYQEKCAGDVIANYTLKNDGTVLVLNRCRLADGGEIKAEGVARVVGKGNPNSILKVRFAPAFLSFLPQVWGDYQIISLSPDYTHALVGGPDREYLWILSRSPRIDDAAYDRLAAEAAAQGFDIRRLQRTKQSQSANDGQSD